MLTNVPAKAISAVFPVCVQIQREDNDEMAEDSRGVGVNH